MLTRIIGPGRAGTSLHRALTAAGWDVDGPHGRGQDPSARAGAADGVDLLVIATRDAEVAAVAGSVRPRAGTTVAHLSGLLGLDALAPHRHRAAVHPLVSLPDADVGALRLGGGAWFGLRANAPRAEAAARAVVTALGGRSFSVPEEDRARYHAAAAIAANHLVAVLAQAERVGASAGVPPEALLTLARGALENVDRLGPHLALTGPVARGDWETVAAHLDALDEGDRPAYRALAAEAARLAGVEPPPGLLDPR
ncbi:MAG TPA: DUF2520 domain-containing protein [Acidimicrobiales bacterium]|nr:DUF2520 domain-containing protein [Acidimicrobiales bacterium]